MTTTQPALVPATDTARRFRLRAAVLIAPIGPIAIAVLRGILPYNTSDDSATIAARIATHHAAGSGVLWLTLLAILTLPLGVLIVGRVAILARPVLGTIAATVAWLGFLSLFATTYVDIVALAAPDSGMSTTAVASLIDAMDAQPIAGIAIGLFVAGHILGTVLLGIAIWRVIPRWAALALIVSQPLHLVFAVIVPNHALDAVAWLLTTVGFTCAALAYARLVRPGC